MNQQKIAALVLKLAGFLTILEGLLSFYSETVMEYYYQTNYIEGDISPLTALSVLTSIVLVKCVSGITLILLAKKIAGILCNSDEDVVISKPDPSFALKTAIPLIGIYGFLFYFPYAVYTISLWIRVKIATPTEDTYDYQELTIQYSIGLVVIFFLIFRTNTVIKLIEKFSK